MGGGWVGPGPLARQAGRGGDQTPASHCQPALTSVPRLCKFLLTIIKVCFNEKKPRPSGGCCLYQARPGPRCPLVRAPGGEPRSVREAGGTEQQAVAAVQLQLRPAGQLAAGPVHRTRTILTAQMFILMQIFCYFPVLHVRAAEGPAPDPFLAEQPAVLLVSVHLQKPLQPPHQ